MTTTFTDSLPLVVGVLSICFWLARQHIGNGGYRRIAPRQLVPFTEPALRAAFARAARSPQPLRRREPRPAPPQSVSVPPPRGPSGTVNFPTMRNPSYYYE